jgi:SAM-dependent methyltransferase
MTDVKRASGTANGSVRSTANGSARSSDNGSARVADEVAQYIAGMGPRASLRVLDAGAGATSRLKLPPTARVTGIDVEEATLLANDALSERIVGDLATAELPPGAFDVVVCWDVLEHLPDPIAAVSNMSQALAPGGLLVIAGPNLWSTKGLLTKFTPHWFHVFVYRRLLHKPDAGLPGHSPFPTYMRFAIAPRRLAGSCAKLDLRVVMLEYFGGIAYRLPAPLRSTWNVLNRLANAVSFGLRSGDSDFCLLAQRSPASTASPASTGQ